jgi:catechol 2,3-dioxygenase-like lactoylglutathione lyase family enzyme
MPLQITKQSIDIGIITKDAAPMLSFYRDTLGLEFEGEMAMAGGGNMVRLKCGTTVVKIVTHGKEPEGSAPSGGIRTATGYRYWTISVSNIEAATAECADAGYRVTVPVTEIRPGVSISMIEDPDGNWVELLQIT